MRQVYNSILSFILEPRASRVLGKCFTNWATSQPFLFIYFLILNFIIKKTADKENIHSNYENPETIKLNELL